MRSGRLFQKFLMLWKGESALHVAVVVGTLKAFTGMHLGKLAWCPVSGFIRQGLRLLWCQTSGGGRAAVGRSRVVLPHRTRCIGGDMHCHHSRDVEDVAIFKTHQRSVSESSPALRYDHFGDLECHFRKSIIFAQYSGGIRNADCSFG